MSTTMATTMLITTMLSAMAMPRARVWMRLMLLQVGDANGVDGDVDFEVLLQRVTLLLHLRHKRHVMCPRAAPAKRAAAPSNVDGAVEAIGAHGVAAPVLRDLLPVCDIGHATRALGAEDPGVRVGGRGRECV